MGTCLLVCAWSLPGRAQEKKPDPQADAQQQTAPPVQQQTPPVQQQTPPAQPPPTPPPAQQQPPPEAGTQAQQHGRIPEPPPPPPKVPDVRRPGESGLFIGLSAWMPTEQPIFDRGSGRSEERRVGKEGGSR